MLCSPALRWKQSWSLDDALSHQLAPGLHMLLLHIMSLSYHIFREFYIPSLIFLSQSKWHSIKNWHIFAGCWSFDGFHRKWCVHGKPVIQIKMRFFLQSNWNTRCWNRSRSSCNRSDICCNLLFLYEEKECLVWERNCRWRYPSRRRQRKGSIEPNIYRIESKHMNVSYNSNLLID